MNYTDAINDITTQGKFRICLGLERISQLLDLLHLLLGSSMLL